MRKITGNKLLVRALKEEGVDTIFGYRERAPLISATNCINRTISVSSSRALSRRWSMRRTHMRGPRERWVSALLRAVRELPIWHRACDSQL